MKPTTSFIRCIVVISALLATPISWGDDWLYTVRPGDKLWTIATDYCGSGRFVQAIADHNGFAISAQLQAGQRIAIPTSLLAFSPSNATVTQVTGNVVLQRRDGKQSPAQAGDAVNMGDHLISTDGAALIVFADGSQISVAPDSRVLFNKLTAFGPAGMVDTHLRFTYGQGEASVKLQNRGDRFRIQTPEGIAAVRGTKFRVGRINQDHKPIVSTTETLEGLVAYSGQGENTDVPAGFGVAASVSGVVKEALLAAPVFNELPEQITAESTVSWQTLAGAQEYVIEWALADRPEIVAISTSSTKTSTQPLQTPGTYLLTVRGVSSSRIQGNNATVPLKVLDPAPTDLTETISRSGQVTFQWRHPQPVQQYTIVVAADHWTNENEWRSSQTSYTAEFTAGHYRWHVKPDPGATSETRSFTVLPAPPERFSVNQDKLSLSVTIEPAMQGVRYRIDLLNSAGEVLQQKYSRGETSFELPKYGHYQLQVASEQNSLHSKPVTTQIDAQQKPWWLLLFFPLMAI
ncbi:MAG: FecR domain-containing protein [Pseudomonadaceae bacterium]|nr:FecR domain-containing protein [Pseudomonadaceae bacterium]